MADLGVIKAIEDGAQALINGLKIQFFVPYNGKIADITCANTNKYTLDLAAVLSETRKIIMVILGGERMGGTGYLYGYPMEGTNWVDLGLWGASAVSIVIKDGTQNLQYSLSVANDDFDLDCLGYVVEA